MPIRDELKINHAGIHLKRAYPLRARTLELNKELQKMDDVKPTDGLRAFARFPQHEIERLAVKGRTDRDTPNWYADLDSRDAEIMSKARIKLVNSVEGREYRVGGTSRKSFTFKNNPLAR